MNLRKLTGQEIMVAPSSMQDDDVEAKKWKIDIEGLAKRLAGEDLELVEDGMWLKVVQKA